MALGVVLETQLESLFSVLPISLKNLIILNQMEKIPAFLFCFVSQRRTPIIQMIQGQSLRRILLHSAREGAHPRGNLVPGNEVGL